VGRVCACTFRFCDRKGVERSAEVRAASVYEAACRAWAVFKSDQGTEQESYKAKEFVVEVQQDPKVFRVELEELLAWLERGRRGGVSLTHNSNMSAEEKTIPPEVLQRVVWIQGLTLVWMSVEGVVSLGAAWAAHSPALLGFGGDSAVELLSAAVVLWRFYSRSLGGHAEQRAARIAGGLLFVLAAFVALASILTLLGHVEVRPSPIGIVLLILAAVVMPWLARRKRQLSIATASAALRADAAESSVCGYLALIALAGLATNAIWHVRWADPVAALTLLPLIAREGWEASKGKACC
jgi:Co/Zn/Cd efflux system component